MLIDKYRESDKDIDEEQIIKWVIEILLAVHYMHERLVCVHSGVTLPISSVNCSDTVAEKHKLDIRECVSYILQAKSGKLINYFNKSNIYKNKIKY